MATKEAFIVANLEELIIHTTRAWHDFVRFVDALSDDNSATVVTTVGR